jgi:hypothetical protein
VFGFDLEEKVKPKRRKGRFKRRKGMSGRSRSLRRIR